MSNENLLVFPLENIELTIQNLDKKILQTKSRIETFGKRLEGIDQRRKELLEQQLKILLESLDKLRYPHPIDAREPVEVPS